MSVCGPLGLSLSVRLSVSLSVCLSVCLFICLWFCLFVSHHVMIFSQLGRRLIYFQKNGFNQTQTAAEEDDDAVVNSSNPAEGPSPGFLSSRYLLSRDSASFHEATEDLTDEIVNGLEDLRANFQPIQSNYVDVQNSISREGHQLHVVLRLR